MQALPTQQLPALEKNTEGKVAVYLNPDYSGEVDCGDVRRLPAIVKGLEGRSSRQAGRISSWHWQPQWHEGPGLVVRQYVHGGLCGKLAGALFFRPARMKRELQLAIHARRHQVPTAPPVAVRIERSWGPLVTGYYVSEAIPQAQNLLEFFAALNPEQGLTARQRRRLTAGIAAAIADMHDAGIVHGDLNLKNLLVRDAFDEPQVFIIDFDSARLAGRLSLRQRMANLLRLDRSMMKWSASRRLVSARDRLRVVRSYLERYPAWRSQWARIARKYAGRHLRHHFSRERDEGAGR